MLDTLQQPSNGNAIESEGICSRNSSLIPPLKFWKVQDYFQLPRGRHVPDPKGAAASFEKERLLFEKD